MLYLMFVDQIFHNYKATIILLLFGPSFHTKKLMSYSGNAAVCFLKVHAHLFATPYLIPWVQDREMTVHMSF